MSPRRQERQVLRLAAALIYATQIVPFVPVSLFVNPLPPSPPRRERLEFPRRIVSPPESVAFAQFVDRNKFAIYLVPFRVRNHVRLWGLFETADDGLP